MCADFMEETTGAKLHCSDEKFSFELGVLRVIQSGPEGDWRPVLISSVPLPLCQSRRHRGGWGRRIL